MTARLLLAAACALTYGTAVAQPPRPSSAKDDRAAMQKSMNDFKRGVGESGRRETGAGQFLGRPTLSGLQIRSSISVPDGGETLLGGITNSSEGRNSAGLGPLQNRATGKSTSKTTASARVWVIIFSEEEERQTGYSPKR